MHFACLIAMLAIHAILFVLAGFKELGGHLREHRHSEDVLLLLEIFRREPGAQLLHLRLDQIGRAALDRLLVAQDLLAKRGIDRGRRPAVFTLDKPFEFLCNHLVPLAHDHIEHSLRTHDLGGRRDKRRIAGVLADIRDLAQNVLEFVLLAGLLELRNQV